MKHFDPDSLYHVFVRVIKLHYNRAHSLLEKIGLYPGQPFLLLALFHQDGQSQKELGEKLRVKASTITVMIRRLEKANIVERKQDEIDQRISRVYLTEKGKQVCEKVNENLFQVEQECFRNFTNEEKLLLRRLLMQMGDNLSNVLGEKISNNEERVD